MASALPPVVRSAIAGTAAAALLIGAFAIGAGQGSAAAAAPSTGTAGGAPAGRDAALLTAAPGSARITVTGTGAVTGTPNQLTLGMGVHVNAPWVAFALQQANAAVRRVTASLRARGVAARDIQTSGLYIQPSYPANSSVPSGYGVSELLTATLTRLAVAGSQIQAAVRAGGNATTVDNVSLSMTDNSALLGTARARAIADARVKAAQYARALGQQLGPVISASDQTSVVPLPEFGGAAASSAKAVPISPGSQQLSVSVTVVYALA